MGIYNEFRKNQIFRHIDRPDGRQHNRNKTHNQTRKAINALNSIWWHKDITKNYIFTKQFRAF
jgi:hypothetical protein